MPASSQLPRPIITGADRRPLRADVAFGAMLLLCASVAALPPVAAEAQGLPSPHLLAARHDSLVGGRAVLEGHRSMKLTGSFTIPEAGIEAPMEILKLRPNKYLYRSTLGPLGEILTGFDGTTAWAVQPGTGAMILDGEPARQLADQADFFGDLHDYSRFTSVETVDLTEFNGARAHRVRMVRASGDTLVEYFDATSGLTIGGETSVGTPQGRVRTTSLYGDYRTFGGLTVATRIEQRNPGFRAVITITAIEFDTLDEAAVAPPESVRALVKSP